MGHFSFGIYIQPSSELVIGKSYNSNATLRNNHDNWKLKVFLMKYNWIPFLQFIFWWWKRTCWQILFTPHFLKSFYLHNRAHYPIAQMCHKYRIFIVNAIKLKLFIACNFFVLKQKQFSKNSLTINVTQFILVFLLLW